MMVTADLARLLKHDRVEVDWVTVSSYGSGTSSSGLIRLLKEPDTDLAGRNVLIVEDLAEVLRITCRAMKNPDRGCRLSADGRRPLDGRCERCRRVSLRRRCGRAGGRDRGGHRTGR